MWFKVVIQSRVGKGPLQGAERSFDQSKVTVGRGAKNDLPLPDTQRIVSSRHAEIRRQDNQFVFVDLGSTNGTKINKKKVTPKNEYVLKKKDNIEVGPYVLQFYPQSPVGSSQSSAVDQGEALIVTGPTKERGAQLEQALRRVLHAGKGNNQKEVEGNVEAILRQAINGLSREEAFQLLDAIQAKFSEQAKPAVSELLVDPRPRKLHVQDPPPRQVKHKAEVESISKLLNKYVEGKNGPWSEEEINQSMQRIERIVDVIVTNVDRALKGRKQFQRGFEVEATRIFSWSPNPIKLAENPKKIGAYLLDPMGDPGSMEKMISDLEEIFQDLTLHQLGLIAGFQECLRGLLEQVTPEAFEEEEREEAGGLFQTDGRVQTGAWQRFKEKHRKLSEEEVRVFETILAPHFAKGYLSVQQTKDAV